MSDIKGTNGDDILTGTGNDDIFNGGAGADTLDGGAGKDMALYWDSPEGVTIDLSTVDGDGYALGAGGHAYGDRLKNIEQLWGSDHGDFLMGGSQDNLLLGGGGADALYGGAGDDFLGGGKGDDDLSGGPGADTLDGGAGKDSALYLFSESGVSINLSAFVAVLLYVIYSNMLGVAKTLLKRDEIPGYIGLWWVHLALLVLIFLMFQFPKLRLRMKQFSTGPVAG